MADRKQYAKIVQRIALLEEAIDALRSNQVRKISYGNITIDGTGSQGIINVGNGITITVDNNGNGQITVKQGTILVNDGTNNRCLFGYQAGGF